MICFARSGGTLLNRCLGSLPDVVIMSEVNPLGGGWGEKKESSPNTIQEQAKQWYGIELRNNIFENSALELSNICIKNNKKLIIRDWSFINFTPHEYNNFTPPNKLLSIEKLKGQNKLRTFAFVRDSIDVWISRGMPLTQDFFTQYSLYIDELIKNDIKIFKYENFCKNPDLEMKKICMYIDIPYSDSYKKYNDFTNVSGDVQGKQKPRSITHTKIRPVARKTIPLRKIFELNGCSQMRETNKLLGYKTSYYISNWMRLKVWVKNIFLILKRLKLIIVKS